MMMTPVASATGHARVVDATVKSQVARRGGAAAAAGVGWGGPRVASCRLVLLAAAAPCTASSHVASTVIDVARDGRDEDVDARRLVRVGERAEDLDARVFSVRKLASVREIHPGDDLRLHDVRDVARADLLLNFGAARLQDARGLLVDWSSS